MEGVIFNAQTSSFIAQETWNGNPSMFHLSLNFDVSLMFLLIPSKIDTNGSEVDL